METKLIEVALALVVMYLVLALLATQLSELWAGAFSSRQRNLELIVAEAFDGNAALERSFFTYGPIQALSKNNSMGGMLKGRRRPSSIPADLFANAFLAVLNKGTPPRTAFRAPSEFVTQLEAQPATKQSLAALVAGTETDWDVFEARVARWFSDITDRGEGWYKRRNALWMLITAIVMSVLVNADSAFVAKRLFEDDELRVSVANIGERIVIEETRGQSGTPSTNPAPPPPSAAEFDRASQAAKELNATRSGINSAIASDTKVAGFGYDLANLGMVCAGRDSKDTAWYATNSDAWRVLIPSIQLMIREARVAVALPSDGTEIVVLDRQQRTAKLQRVSACLSAVSVWVNAAFDIANSDKGRTGLKEAGEALERASRIVDGLTASAAIEGSLHKRFVADSERFIACADESGRSRSDFDQCLRASQGRRIPLGWPPQADQFCDVGVRTTGAVATTSRDARGLFGCVNYAGNDALGLPSFASTFSWSKAVAAVLGILLTAVLVSLGAPFWFGTLSKLANLRAAGRVRDADTGKASDNPSDRTLIAAAAAKPGDPGTPPFDDARNEFERGLRPQDITRLQNALGVPATARLDQVTRNAIGAKILALQLGGGEELGSVSYQAIVGRAAASVTPVEISSGTWSRGHNAETAVQALVTALNRIFPAAAWTPLPITAKSFDDDIRARVVLYRARIEDPKPYETRTVTALANQRNGELTRLDDRLRQAITNDTRTFARTVPPWLDDALGELGVTENGAVAQSDPRVIEYLKSLGSEPIAGDQTPWCGAFMGWVMQRAGKTIAANYAAAPDTLLLAANWGQFGNPVANGSEQPGDICIIPSGTSHHVALYIAQDASRLWLLGGNQGPDGSGSVTLVAFRKPMPSAPVFRQPK